MVNFTMFENSKIDHRPTVLKQEKRTRPYFLMDCCYVVLANRLCSLQRVCHTQISGLLHFRWKAQEMA